MELKKSDKANLEKKKNLFLELGFVIALALIWGAMEYKSSPRAANEAYASSGEVIEEEIIPITRPEVQQAPPPPAAPSEILKLVADDVTLDMDFEIDVEADLETEVEIREITSKEVGPRVEAVEEEELYTLVEDMPKFQGKDYNTFRDWIAKNLKYPDVALENGVSGRVYVKFIVNSKGEVGSVTVARSSGDTSLDNEAVRVISSSPKWTPGSQQGKPVRVEFLFPVLFKISN